MKMKTETGNSAVNPSVLMLRYPIAAKMPRRVKVHDLDIVSDCTEKIPNYFVS